MSETLEEQKIRHANEIEAVKAKYAAELEAIRNRPDPELMPWKYVFMYAAGAAAFFLLLNLILTPSSLG